MESQEKKCFKILVCHKSFGLLCQMQHFPPTIKMTYKLMIVTIGDQAPPKISESYVKSSLFISERGKQSFKGKVWQNTLGFSCKMCLYSPEAELDLQGNKGFDGWLCPRGCK